MVCPPPSHAPTAGAVVAVGTATSFAIAGLPAASVAATAAALAAAFGADDLALELARSARLAATAAATLAAAAGSSCGQIRVVGRKGEGGFPEKSVPKPLIFAISFHAEKAKEDLLFPHCDDTHAAVRRFYPMFFFDRIAPEKKKRKPGESRLSSPIDGRRASIHFPPARASSYIYRSLVRFVVTHRASRAASRAS